MMPLWNGLRKQFSIRVVGAALLCCPVGWLMLGFKYSPGHHQPANIDHSKYKLVCSLSLIDMHFEQPYLDHG